MHGAQVKRGADQLQLPLAPDAVALQTQAAEQREVAEARRLWEEDEATLRSLRMALREIATKLLCAKQWKEFWEPVRPEDDPHYYSQVTCFESMLALSTLAVL